MSFLKTKFIIVTLLLITLLLGGCTQNPIQNEQNGKLSIVTTIYPLYEFAKEVGKDKIEVTLLLPPGVEAHTFEPKPSDIIKVSKANLFIYTGAGMEPWAEDILQGVENKNLIILDSSTKVNLIKFEEEHYEEDETEHKHNEEELLNEEHHEETEHEAEDHPHEEEIDHAEEEHHHNGEYDPHIWLDFSNDTKIVLAIAEELARIDSNNKQFYLENANNYIKKLNELDDNYSKTLADCDHNEIITGGHSAFGYLAKKYSLETLSASGISPDSEPTPQKIKEIVDLIKEHKLNYVYFEELVNPSIAQAIANETGAKTLILNPAANLTKEKFDGKTSFISIMNDNLLSLKTGLECN